MATCNSADGTGGLDASIRFAEEQARAEVRRLNTQSGLALTRPHFLQNAGDAFSNTMQIISSQVDRYISSNSPKDCCPPPCLTISRYIVADSIALAALVAIENWCARHYLGSFHYLIFGRHQAEVLRSPSVGDALMLGIPMPPVCLNLTKISTHTSPPLLGRGSRRQR